LGYKCTYQTFDPGYRGFIQNKEKKMSRERARKLRKNMTDAERALWLRIRRRQIVGYKFRRQQPLGKYILDFVCLESKLIVELDGGQHAVQEEYDSRRSQWLTEQGFRVLRFWNHQVFKESDAVVQAIYNALLPPTRPTKGRTTSPALIN
jgi:very-short-patch-repair endonuclease